jgi:hypothetical protein
VRVHSRFRLLHEPHQSLGGEDSTRRTHQRARNGLVYRTTVLRRLRPSLGWVSGETRQAGRELLQGRVAMAAARVTGLASGSVEAARRTIARRFAARPSTSH